MRTANMVSGVLLATLLLHSAAADSALTCDGLLYATGFDGEPSHGSRDTLIAAVNRGEPIRIGWQLDFDDDGRPDLTHWSDAAFLSVWRGDVFAQVQAIHAQRPQRDGDMHLTAPYTEWRGNLGTTGTLEGAYSDGRSFAADIRVSITWCSALPGQRGWALLYRNSVTGEDLAGSKAALFAAIRSGQPIRIAWGFEAQRDGRTISVEHQIEPVFVSIIGETDVAAQLPEHIAQRHYIDIDRALFDDPAVMWRGLMTTRGVFDAVWVDRATGETVRRYPQRAAMSWFAPVSPDLATPSLAVPGGVGIDTARSDERVPE